MAGRDKRPLGDLFGLTNFGVNITRLAPGGWSALRHAHTKQDEFIYILEGSPTLLTDAGRTALHPGMCAGFKAGSGDSHCLVNESGADVVYLEIGDRTAGDAVEYPYDDLAAVTIDGECATDGAQGRRAVLIGDGGSKGYFQLTGYALRQHKPRRNPPRPARGVFVRETWSCGHGGVSRVAKRGRTVNPLAKPS